MEALECKELITEMSGASSVGRRTIAEKLDHLFHEVHPRGRGPFSYKEVAEGIKERAGEGDVTPSHSIIQQIRTGANTNPKIKTLEAIAGYFGVSSSYFFDDAITEQVDARLQELKKASEQASAQDDLADALEDGNIRAVAFRLSGLSAATLRSIRGIVDHAREVEGLPDIGPSRRQRR